MSAEPSPRDDGGAHDDAAARVPSNCPLCGAPTTPSDDRCPACSMSLAGTGGRPGPFSRAVLVAWCGVLLAIFVVALVVVALVPA